MEISFRPATREDLDLLDAMHTECIRAHVQRVYPWRPDLFRATFDPSITRVIMIGGIDAGMLKVSEDSDGMHLRTILLRPEYQKRGIGGSIIAELVKSAHARGTTVRLQVLRGNPARRLYERLGFRLTGQTPTHYLMTAALDGAPELDRG